MKKLSIIALTIMTFGMISCDMDLMPYDSIPTEEALKLSSALKKPAQVFMLHIPD